MQRMSRSILLRSAILQTLLVGVLSVLLAVALGASFFTHWGWIVGPLAWIACSLATARVLALPRRRTLVGAAPAGPPRIFAAAASRRGVERLRDLGIEGRVALVLGASKGIGRAVASELAGEGARVAIASRSREGLEELAAQIGAAGVGRRKS